MKKDMRKWREQNKGKEGGWEKRVREKVKDEGETMKLERVRRKER